MEFALPEFPSEPGAQLAFIATGLILLQGLLMLAIPGLWTRLTRLEQSPVISHGELRAFGGFLAGLALLTLLLDQPVSFAVLGVSMAAGAFGRLVSIVIDRQAVIANLAICLVQALLSAALLQSFTDVYQSGLAVSVPSEGGSLTAFFGYWLLIATGLMTLVSPRRFARLAGFVDAARAPALLAGLRSGGAFLAALGYSGLLLMDQSMNELLVELALVTALVLSLFGRLLAFAFGRRFLGYRLLAFAFTIGLAAIFASSLSTLM